MRVERSIGLGLVAAVLASGSVAAFEPGTPRVCKPSADGQRFECHERGAAGQPTTPTSPSVPTVTPRPSADAPTAAPSPSGLASASAAQAAPPASSSRALPNYLLQTPTRVAPSPSPSPAATETPREVAADVPPPPPSPPAPAAAVSVPSATSRDAPVPFAAPVAEAEATAAPAPATTTPRESVAASSEPAAPAEGAAAPTPLTAPPPTAPPVAAASLARTIAGATEFRRLAVARYTVELAKAPRADAFEALLASLGDVEGILYVVSLRGPEGRSWHLLWSDFASIEEARSARSRLPADAAIASGWPRRIGPLRAELDAP